MLDPEHYYLPWDLSWSPDGTRLAGGGFVWDTVNGKKLVKLYDPRESDVYPEGQLLASPQEIAADRRFQAAPTLDATGYGAWSPDGSLYIGWNPNPNASKNAYIWDTRTFKIVARLSENSKPFIFGWSPDGRSLAATTNDDKLLHVYDSRTLQELFSVGDGSSWVLFPRWSPDGKLLTAGFYRSDPLKEKHLLIWDGNTGAELVDLPSQDGYTIMAAWSPDGKSLAVTYERNVIRIWDTTKWQVKQNFTGHIAEPFAVAWSPDGELLVSSDTSGQIKVWNASDGQEVMGLAAEDQVFSLHWSPDGTTISAAGGHCIPIIFRVWSTTEDLIAYVKAKLVWRELTPAERQQFGLPEKK